METKVLLSVIVSVIMLMVVLLVSCGESAPEPVLAPAPSPSPAPAQAGQTEWVMLPRPIKTLPAGEEEMQWDEPPPMMIDTDNKYRAVMETEKGTVVLELFAKDVPKTVNNFVFLATQGYYDGTTFHRVIPGFMAQGGDPTGTGRGGPGYRFEDEFTGHRHGTGALSMANAGPDTNGSQFFITYSPQPGLDGKHSVFGQLVEGMDVLKNLTPRDPSQNPQFEGDKLIRVDIELREGS